MAAYQSQKVSHEGAVRSAFQNLLAATAKPLKWTLIPELGRKVNGHTIFPDGTLRDTFHIPRGFWEAKDTDDDLRIEIDKKIKSKYPLSNTIFEDTRTAVLFQNNSEVLEVDLSDPEKLARLLNQFYSHEQPDILQFEQAVEEFRETIPDLGRGLQEKITDAHLNNARFKTAFADFFALCQTSLNPNIREAAVDEMLIQHLLTERLIRTIFDNTEFTRRNVIAVEVEKVIGALVSKSFNRKDFLKSLDRFYVAIENAARGLDDFSEKQHFLNTVYERFFQGYSVKVADTMGIVYTPQPIVDFMCASVAEVLKTEFDKVLGSEDVYILDPCTGTGNFIVNLLKRVPRRYLKKVYREQFFANEIMLLPYYIAALNIEHAYYEITGEYEPFEGLCFVDTLDIAEKEQTELGFMTPENTERVERQRKTPITVIIGNPPYNVGQINENDNNKNRKYETIDRRIKDTYAKDSTATNKNALSDAYVKFFRWAVDRLNGRDGIICFVSNNSFVDQIAFDGMRKHLEKDFTRIYHVDLHGNVRRNPKLSGTTHNVFGIQVGVGITVAVRKARHKKTILKYHRVPEFWRREDKYSWLRDNETLKQVKWTILNPDKNHNWILAENADKFETFMPLGTKEDKADKKLNVECVFKLYSRGVATCRDSIVYDYNEDKLKVRVKQFIEDYNTEVDRWKRAPKNTNVDDFVNYHDIQWSMGLKISMQRGKYAEFDNNKIRHSHYRPFCCKYLFFDRILNEAIYQNHHIYANEALKNKNKTIAVGCYERKEFSLLISSHIPDLNFYADPAQCFPFYVYDEDGSNRRENITDWALQEFQSHYKNKKIGKWDIFYYVYGLLHHPQYRTKYADCLKRELPRLPFAPDFAAFSEAGKKLAELHLNYEKLEEYKLKWIETPDMPLSYRVDDKMHLNKDKTELTVNKSLKLTGIPPECFEYRLGNRSALEWVIDQYCVKTDKRSSITSDPNRAEDEQYIVRLVGQVINVSLQTVAIVKSLPADFGG